MKLSDMQSLHYDILWRIIKARIHISFARRMINPLNIAPAPNRGNRKRSWLNLSRRSGLVISWHIDKNIPSLLLLSRQYNSHLSKITPFAWYDRWIFSLKKERFANNLSYLIILNKKEMLNAKITRTHRVSIVPQLFLINRFERTPFPYSISNLRYKLTGRRKSKGSSHCAKFRGNFTPTRRTSWASHFRAGETELLNCVSVVVGVVVVYTYTPSRVWVSTESDTYRNDTISRRGRVGHT